MGALVALVEARREGVVARAARGIGERGRPVALVGAATLLAVAIAGYHPFAEDGGIYLTGVKRLLDAGLYAHDAAFATEPARWSWFAPLVAGLVRVTHLPLEWMLLALHVASVWATLFAAWMLAKRCFAEWEARSGAVVLLACWLGLPVAGTALFVMDPYLTARSFATPAMLLALGGVLDATNNAWPRLQTHSIQAEREWGKRRRHGWGMCFAGLAVCAAMHPLTATYAALATAMLTCVRAQHREIRIGGTAAVCVMAAAFAACAQMFAAAERPDYVRAALTRSYWFLSEWHWYEVMGLMAPVGILAAVGWSRKIQSQIAMPFSNARANCHAPEVSGAAALARMAVLMGTMACAVAVAFARGDVRAHLVARMQPLRVFQVVYVVMVLMLGGWLGERVLRRSIWKWTAAVLLLGAVMFGSARAEYPSSDHLELPWIAAENAWVQGFEWIRGNTPRDALFSMDADYIHMPGEDAQNFRAIAERSVLPDASKDGGEASIAPDLAAAWARGVRAQKGLNAATDVERLARLRPLGVSWIVLGRSAKTQLDCPYANASVKVCRLR